jgi:hypothetical protein
LTSLDKAIDKFCYKHNRFGIPNLMKFIVAGNVIVYLFSAMDRSGTFLSLLYFEPTLIMHGQFWRLITFIFIPTMNNLLLYAITLYFYYIVGNFVQFIGELLMLQR